MTARAPQPASPALAAFLRGIERRGAVLAELQAGDADAGDAALATAMRQFRDEAGALPMGEWPQRFWSTLLGQPQLRRRVPVALPLDATDRLDELGSGPRAALLLRLAAGLEEDAAAAVLGIERASYRLALQRALPRDAGDRADPRRWEQLREQVHRRIKTLPPQRLARLTAARETALRASAGTVPPQPRMARVPRAPTGRPRWLLPLLWSLLGLCAAGFAATFWWPLVPHYRGVEPGHVRQQSLPEEAPAARYSRAAALVSHRDFELLADPAGEAQAQSLAFHSWLLARGKLEEAEGGE